MRRTRLHLAIVLTALGALGAWGVGAQEIFLPPPVLQPDAPPPAKEPEKKAPAPPKYPIHAQSLSDKSKADKAKADPTLIIPPEVWEIPHPMPGSPVDGNAGLVQTQGAAVPPPVFPPPVFPPPPPAVQPMPPPGLPAPEPKAVVLPAIPAPPPEPTKMLIEPLSQDPPGRLKKTTETPLPAPPPTLVFPPPPPGNVPGPAADRTKAFVRLRSAANEIMPPPLDIAPAPPPGVVGYGPLVPPPGLVVPNPNPNALLNLQTPAVGVEKRGSATLRAGETQTYQIVIRNLGSTPAQQVRIEEEIPPGAQLVAAEPQAQRQGTRAIWTLSLAPGSEQVVRLTLQAAVALQLGVTTSVHVSAMQPISTIALRPPNSPSPLTVRLSGPQQAAVGKPVAFDVQLTNQSGLPLTGIVLFGYLPEGLDTPQGREIEGAVGGVIAPGGVKVLKMPASAVKPGHYTVSVKVKSSAGEASATATIDIAAESLTVQQAALTRLVLGRDGDLRIEVANSTGKPLRHVQVASVLPDGLAYLGASDRGYYQANYNTVYWLIDAMQPGQAQTLAVKVSGAKPGQYQNVVSARADGVPEIHSTGAVALTGMANLKVRVVDRDPLLEVGKDTVYEVQISNSGGAAAHNVRLAVAFPPGLIPGKAEGPTRQAGGLTVYTPAQPIKSEVVSFEPSPSLAPDDQSVVYRVSAHARSAGDQRVQFMIFSDELQTPLVHEVSTKVY